MQTIAYSYYTITIFHSCLIHNGSNFNEKLKPPIFQSYDHGLLRKNSLSSLKITPMTKHTIYFSYNNTIKIQNYVSSFLKFFLKLIQSFIKYILYSQDLALQIILGISLQRNIYKLKNHALFLKLDFYLRTFILQNYNYLCRKIIIVKFLISYLLIIGPDSRMIFFKHNKRIKKNVTCKN